MVVTGHAVESLASKIFGYCNVFQSHVACFSMYRRCGAMAPHENVAMVVKCDDNSMFTE